MHVHGITSSTKAVEGCKSVRSCPNPKFFLIGPIPARATESSCCVSAIITELRDFFGWTFELDMFTVLDK